MKDRLSALEWSVVAIARKDRLSSLRRPGRVARAMRSVFGARGANPTLADERLEALRRVAVWAWHRGYALPALDVRRFLDAGFSEAQLEAVIESVQAGKTAKPCCRYSGLAGHVHAFG